jgi:hypothetical protein
MASSAEQPVLARQIEITSGYLDPRRRLRAAPDHNASSPLGNWYGSKLWKLAARQYEHRYPGSPRLPASGE